jgi:hypothetical protein
MQARKPIVALVSLCALVSAAWLLPAVAVSGEARESARPLAEMSMGASRIDWQTAGDYGRLVLTVAGPEGLWLRKEIAAGQPISLSLVQEDGLQFPDGSYTYELWPVSSRETPLVQSGHFSIRNGSFVTPSAKPPLRNVTANLTDDDLIIQGYGCIGEECTTSDDDFPVLRLKGQNPNILFDDVEPPPSLVSSSFNDWAIRINPSDVAKFSIFDVDGSLTPFSILGGAPDNSLFISDNGDVGIGTATPAERLHVVENADANTLLTVENPNAGTSALGGIRAQSDSAIVNFQAHGSGRTLARFGQTLASWAEFLQVTGNGFILGTLADKPLILGTNNTNRVHITGSGNIGIGTTSPATRLHLFGDTDAPTVLQVENTSSGVNAVGNFRAQSNTAVVHFRAHGSGRTVNHFGVVLGGWAELVQDIGNGLAIGTLNSTPIILGTNNTNRLQIDGSTGTVTIAGNLTVNGTFSNPSSRELKEGFEPVDPRSMLDRFAQLPIQEWSYRSDDRKLRHVGPTVEDFQSAFGLGTEGQHIFPMDVQGVTMTAVQGLYQVVQEKDAEIAALRERLAALEELVSKLAAQQ